MLLQLNRDFIKNTLSLPLITLRILDHIPIPFPPHKSAIDPSPHAGTSLVTPFYTKSRIFQHKQFHFTFFPQRLPSDPLWKVQCIPKILHAANSLRTLTALPHFASIIHQTIASTCWHISVAPPLEPLMPP